ncbi:hypothetical protein Tco_0604157 [Tanacetum coccineum]
MSTLVNTSSTEISVLKQKHDELLKKSLLTRSQFEGQLKEKTKVISDLKVKEGKDIDTMIEMDKQIKFLNEILYKRNQSIQTIHMLAPKCATYHGRSTFANPKYLKKAQSDKPRLYEIPYDTSDPANRFCPDGEETVTLEKESRSKLDKDTNKTKLSGQLITSSGAVLQYLPRSDGAIFGRSRLSGQLITSSRAGKVDASDPIAQSLVNPTETLFVLLGSCKDLKKFVF